MRSNSLTPLLSLVMVVTAACANYYDRTPSVTEINSNISNLRTERWKITMVPDLDIGSPSKGAFPNEKTGFISSYNDFSTVLHRTEDSGLTWRPIAVFDGFLLRGVHFTSEMDGFVALLSTRNSTYPGERGSSVLETRDGGKTWSQNYSSTDGAITAIRVCSDHNMIIVGEKRNPEKGFSSFVLASSDAGRGWQDLSDSLNELTGSNGRDEEPHVRVFSAVCQSEGNVMILSSDYRIYRLNFTDSSWEFVSKLPTVTASTAVTSVEFSSDGSTWIAGGANAIEGIWSQFDRLSPDGHWQRTAIPGYFLHDFKIVSDNELLAVGSRRIGRDDEMEGVILYSSDYTKTWETLAVHEVRESFTGIVQLSSTRFLITSASGDVFLVEKLDSGAGHAGSGEAKAKGVRGHSRADVEDGDF